MEIVIATRNIHKLREFRELFKPLKGIDLLSLLDFPNYVPPEETGTTFLENATLKAEHAAKHLNKWAFADDSGLVVPALQGAPGIYSARYAGAQASDADNRKKLLQEMQALDGLQRSAHFECCLVLCSPEGMKKHVTGVCEGYLLSQERGSNGFGYDPLFVKNDYDKTFAELGESFKNRISHRYKAFEKMRLYIESLPEAHT